ncbi:hypothetical protein DES53_12063 [Roseimicrobium gellanilyticum]|uniref:Uncharacterized protein n=1 Tax=Roseimicrobium gellanilyticum TaxID=748857 RepID=A0A366H1E2_9BACT|nr:hypothetical protein [Roseimicrobium gellanilyticum]RBP35694.1 hypothetical protein DES53_12063 [Roseimicrobium gellanilyticum]
MKPTFAACLLLPLCASVSIATAQQDPDLPQRVEPTEVAALTSASPFTRSLNLSDSLVLTGIAYIEGKPVVTVMNKETKESHVVGELPNAQGWKLAETSATVKLDRTQAKLMIGTEVVTVRYSQEQLTPEAMKKGGYRPGGGDGRHDGERRDDGPRRDFPRPSEEDRQRFMSMSEEARKKFIDIMRENGEKMRMASPEERSAFIRNIRDRVEAEDKQNKR